MSPRLARMAWTAALALVLLVPLALRVASGERTGLWNEVTIDTGLLATSMLAALVVMISRLSSVTRAFGVEAMLGAHRTMGLAVVGLLGAHVFAILAEDPAAVWLFAPTVAPARAMWGTAGVLAAVALVGLASARARAQTGYETWRWWHAGLAAAVLISTVAHIVLLAHLAVDPVFGTFLGGLAGAVTAVLLYRWVVHPFDPRDRFVVDAVRRESDTVSTVVLRPANPRSAMQFEPGQFAWLRLGRTPFAEEHPFTIASAAQDGYRPAFTIRHYGNARLALLRRGDVVWLDGPHGGLTPGDSTTGLVLIAGGVGITPMMSMVRTLARRADGRPIRLILADRPGERLFRDELTTLQTQLNLDIAEALRARITADWLEATLPGQPRRDQLDYFVCGSPKMVGDATGALAELGIPNRQVHTELFGVG